ncbi:hypothetical protein B9Z55_028253 [Caenorhabditis nigoni]|uniref:Integrase catalytic domain-containing protein n=1 Tax=Caenorhabditis nigoni TaxID=1611254 RepID=A0A2G5SCF6_9PELO|nr:hypothetical protein B9Z55_028253 [Caenorhabditis nigoni]
MSLTAQDIRRVEETITTLQKSVLTSINFSKNTTLKNVPKTENIPTGQTPAQYVVAQGITLKNEEKILTKKIADYQLELDKGINILYSVQPGSMLATKAQQIAEKVENEDEKIRKEVSELEEKLQLRLMQISQFAENEQVPKLEKSTFSLRSTPNITNIEPMQNQVSPPVQTYQSRSSLRDKTFDLPMFDGDIESWPAFSDMLNKYVIEDKSINDVMKHHILRTHLRGAPFDLVRPYRTDGSEFSTAVERLNKMYNAPEKQYEVQWNKLMKLPVARNTPESLRATHNDMLAITNGLKPYGSVETQNFQSIIRSKIPNSTLIELLKTRPADTTELLANLDDLISIEESAKRAKIFDREERSTFVTTQKTQNCKYCNRSNHRTFECKTVPTLNARKEFIRKNNLCYNCLNHGHRLQECRSPVCRKCQTKHNASICPKNHSTQRNQIQTSKPFQMNNQTNNYRNHQFGGNPSPNNTNQARWQPPNHQYQARQPQNNMQQPQNNMHLPQNNMHQPQPTWNTQKPTWNTQKPRSESFQPKNQNRPKNNGYQATSHETSLMVANAPIIVNDYIETIPVLMDSGSDLYFVLADFAEKMGMKVIEKNVEMDISGFGKNTTAIQSDRVEFDIILNSDTESTLRVQALTMPRITDLFEPIKLCQEDRDYLEIRNQKTINITKPDPAVALIGCDAFWSLMTNEQKETLPSGRHLISTHLGPVVCGKHDKSATKMHSLIAIFKERPNENISETTLEEYFELSNIGITDGHNEPTNDDIVENFKKTVEINPENKRVVVSLPWKEGRRDQLANNKEVAFCRLKQNYLSNHKKESWKKLIETFNKMEETDVIEEIDNDPNMGYFIPYSQVFNEGNNTTKIRTVFDASSKRKGELSLNNALHQGPSLIPELQGILLRIRKGKYVLSGDIEKAFHAVEINEKDRDFLRFILLKDPTKIPTTDNMRIMRFKRLPFGVNCSPFLLSMTILYGIQQLNAPKELLDSIEKMCYVDNLFLTTDDPEKLPEMYKEAKKYFTEMNMNIREFSVNGPDHFLKPEDKAENKENVKILGYLHNLENDTMQVKVPILKIDPKQKMTKTKIVSAITTIFDPIQYFAPLYLDGKQILRSISDHKIEWSDIMPKNIVEKMIAYRRKIESSPLCFRRHIEYAENEPIQLAVFSDASEHTYGACVYIKTKVNNEPGQFQTHLLVAKQRLCPKNKRATIPRLELLGIFIGVKLVDYVVRELKSNIEKIEIFSDSSIALAQIKNHATIKGEKQPIFVENRCRGLWNTLSSIKENNNKIEISLSHVLTDQNPADHITRGCDSLAELEKTNYPKGPDWLRNENLPNHPTKIENNKLIVPTPKDELSPVNVMLAKTTPNKKVDNDIIPLEKFNDFHKTKRVVALVLRFIKHRIYDKISEKNRLILNEKFPELHNKIVRRSGIIKSEEVIAAEKLLIRNHQSNFEISENRKENRFLALDSITVPSDKIVYQHFRIKGVPKKPVIHTKSALARQIVKQVHENHFHAGPATTLGIILESYSGPGWKRTVKSILKSCSTCRKMNNHSFREAPPADLPERRTTECGPFQHAGVDLIGPIKTQRSTTSEIEKSWVVLFTCATTRLVHLELVRNQSTDEFLLALSRFWARRGYPETMTSDNAATFKLTAEIIRKHTSRECDILAELDSDKFATEKEKNEIQSQNKITKHLTKHNIKWYFNTALSPWQGGFFERLVGLVKKAMKHALGDNQYFTKDLETIMIECESIVNRRPLTYVDEDNEDYKLLRPIDIINPSFESLEVNDSGISDEYGDITSKYLQTRQHVKRFWQIFRRDYLQQN